MWFLVVFISPSKQFCNSTSSTPRCFGLNPFECIIYRIFRPSRVCSLIQPTRESQVEISLLEFLTYRCKTRSSSVRVCGKREGSKKKGRNLARRLRKRTEKKEKIRQKKSRRIQSFRTAWGQLEFNLFPSFHSRVRMALIVDKMFPNFSDTLWNETGSHGCKQIFMIWSVIMRKSTDHSKQPSSPVLWAIKRTIGLLTADTCVGGAPKATHCVLAEIHLPTSGLTTNTVGIISL
jgi:hypothetical protein